MSNNARLTLQIGFSGFQGLLNAVVYGSTDAVRAAVLGIPWVRRWMLNCCEGRTGSGRGLNSGLESDVGAEGVLDPEDEEATRGSSTGAGLR